MLVCIGDLQDGDVIGSVATCYLALQKLLTHGTVPGPGIPQDTLWGSLS